MELTYITKRTDLQKRGLFGNIGSISYTGESYIFRSSSGISLVIPVMGGRAVSIETLLEEQVVILTRILREERKSALHLAEGSGTDVSGDMSDEEEE